MCVCVCVYIYIYIYIYIYMCVCVCVCVCMCVCVCVFSHMFCLYVYTHIDTHARLCIPFAVEHAPSLAIWVDHQYQCGKIMKPLPAGDVKGFQCPWNTYGDTVTIMKNPAYQGDSLSLCEVEVYAFSEGRCVCISLRL